jgi:hypothetical protein
MTSRKWRITVLSCVYLRKTKPNHADLGVGFKQQYWLWGNMYDTASVLAKAMDAQRILQKMKPLQPRYAQLEQQPR